jgi:hypothetical protein
MGKIVQPVVVFLAALATGGLMVNWIGLGRAMSRLSVSTYVEFHQASNHTFDPYMPIVVVGALLGGFALAVLSPGPHSLSANWPSLDPFLTSQSWRLACPQTQIARWSVQSPPDDWASIRASWVRFHIVRTLFSLPGLACYVLACLVSR